MKPDRKCPICQGEFEGGFVPDNAYARILKSKWVKGITGSGLLKLVGSYVEPHDIGTFRCKTCGYLESYAK